MKLRPLGDRLLLKRLEDEQTTPGGIVIPDAAKEKPSRGEVIAVGEGKALDNGQIRPLTVKVGERVLFGKYAGTEIKHEGSEYLIVREDDVIAVLES
ncbi:co-chaperone GroES [Candidatus Methylospira mobilis]|uniref:co-chaperone GroES n=1 Tax=Candidatus Methylospira mobilis TaxID=1808979 RepID=UPI0028E91423|nr:co-chaperone GroES [Candidatus Methylospira mobilis]WNV06841.1 co-chaperone GroES [Candidatus Methylospira mobilis]